MAYISQSMTDSNSPSSMYALIEAQALLIGWTLVDTVVLGATTHKVLFSAAAGNSYNKDWYLDIYYPTVGTGVLYFQCFEFYNVGTKQGVRGGYNGFNDTTPPETTYYSRWGNTGFALNDNNWGNNPGITFVATPFIYYFSITRDRILGFTSNDLGGVLFVGFFHPFTDYSTYVGSLLYPLISGKCSIRTSAWNIFRPTRAPKATGFVGTPGWASLCSVDYGSLSTTSGFNEPLMTFASGAVGYTLSPYNGKVTGIPGLVRFQGGSNSTWQSYDLSTFVGTVDDVIAVRTINTMNRGDTVTVGADTWYCCPQGTDAALFMRGV